MKYLSKKCFTVKILDQCYECFENYIFYVGNCGCFFCKECIMKIDICPNCNKEIKIMRKINLKWMVLK